MSNYGDRLDELKQAAERASRAALDVPGDQWPAPEIQDRCLRVLAFAAAAIDRTDPVLLSSGVFQSLHQTLEVFSAHPPETVATHSDGWCDGVLTALSQLPAANGRGVEQAITETAATFQRSATQRYVDIERQYDTLSQQIRDLSDLLVREQGELRSFSESQVASVEARLETLQAEFQARLSGFQSTLETETTALQRLRTQQTSTFSEQEEARAEAERTRIAQLEDQLKRIRDKAASDVGEQVERIERMADESGALVGAIGLAGTADKFGEEVKDQRRAADRWRLATVALGVVAILGVIYALAENNPEAETFVGKLALSVIFGGVAAYTARQSARHRQREERARDLQLQLTAFSPFIEPLSLEQQEEERVRMARKTFGGAQNVDMPDDETGPSPLSAILQARRSGAAAD